VAFVLLGEAMLFGALISAYLVLRAGVHLWPPPGQPRLPVWTTALNTLVLLGSGLALWRARRGGPGYLYGVALAAGAAFVVAQGAEWARLLAFGLNARGGLYGALFYTLVGTHAVHAVAGLVVLGVTLALARAGRVGDAGLAAASLYWAFVVAVWPVLYVLVYLS